MRTNKILLSSLVVASLLVGIPYLFLVTKDSFLTPLSPIDKRLVFLLSLLICFALIFLLSLLLASIDFLVLPQRKPLLVSIFFAFTSAVVLLNFFDTFLYVLFGYGLVKALGFDRAIWLVAFIGMVLFLTRDFGKLFKYPAKIERQANSYQLNGFQKVLIGLAAGLILIYPMTSIISLKPSKELVGAKEFPNIVLVTVDGLNASHISGLGYPRDTTPFLDGLIDKSISNGFHYSNSANTTGSITSILTGKLPTTTHVIYPPDILRGADRFEHLPAILTDLGYYTAQFGVKGFVDANALNFVDAFNEVNGARGIKASYWERKLPNLPTEFFFFLSWLRHQYSDRLGHVFYLSTLEDKMEVVNEGDSNYLKDNEKFEATSDLIINLDQPVFSHIHVMGTHGKFFNTESRVFSANKDRNSQKPWDTDFYDDSILDVDNHVKRLMTRLEEFAPAEKLFLVITSDHGQGFNVKIRMPLIISYPQEVEPKRLDFESQNLDIAPTILELLGQDIPNWMSGHNLLVKAEKPYPIISTGTSYVKVEEGEWSIDDNKIQAPFYQFGFIQGLWNSEWLRLSLITGEPSEGSVEKPIPTSQHVDFGTLDLKQLLIEQLRSDGFDFKPDFFRGINY